MVMEEQQSDMELDSERVPVPQVRKTSKDSHVETINKATSISRGKPRLRKKALNAAILKQMEFYFSDANLSKDRFLGNLIKENPYIDLNVFITFNKIKELTTDVNRIAKALQASTMLALSEDGTKVRRITPIAQKENTDECTIYVQNLPPDTDHEMLASIFSQYGSVAYVSVPRYKSNKKIKGFAFVEFDTPESAKQCIKSFRKKGCVLPLHTSPNDLLSITTFDDAERDVTLRGNTIITNQNNTLANNTVHPEKLQTNLQITEASMNESEKDADDVVFEMDGQTNESKKPKKRKLVTIETSESGDADFSTTKELETKETESKKKKHNEVNSKDINLTEQNEKSKVKGESSSEESAEKSNKHKNKKKITTNEKDTSDVDKKVDENTKAEEKPLTSSDREDHNDTIDDKKKKRKRKRKSKIEDISYNMGLQVMTKKDWKHLRNKYLELQRSKMKQLKQHLKKTRFNQWSNYEKNKSEREENDDKEKPSKLDNTSLRNFSFTPGVIVKIEMDKPCTDPKNLKMELRGNASIKYIDVNEGSCEAYVRLDTTEAAQSFVQKPSEERHMTILKGDEEKTYWDKILKDREEKLSKKVKVKQRGRAKLLKKAEKALGKHIKFDEV